MTSTHAVTHRERVPAEHRVLGIDRRTLTPALAVLAVFLLFTFVVPRVDASIDWDDPVQPGQRLALTDTLVFTPVSGWNVETGFRAGPSGPGQKVGEATIAADGVTFHVVPDSFAGAPAELLDQIEKVTSRTADPSFRVEGNRSTLTTTNGATGVVEPYSSIDNDGLAAAFVIDGTGLKITAYGPPTQMAASAESIRNMIASIQTVDERTA